MPANSLLTDEIFRVEIACERRLSLPQVLAALSAATAELGGFPALRPHQRFCWHAFLVQLAALAAHRAGVGSVAGVDADTWTVWLRALTPDWPDDAPWCLVVDDPAKPAFLQPPIPEGAIAALKDSVATPDEIDLLVTSKNHDIKQNIAVDAHPDDWVFALVSLQTQGGFSGRDNYGTARMNGGASNRT